MTFKTIVDAISPFFQPEQAPYNDRSIYGDTQSIQIRAPFRIHHSGY